MCFSFSGYCSVTTHGRLKTRALFSKKEVAPISSSTAYTDLRKQDWTSHTNKAVFEVRRRGSIVFFEQSPSQLDRTEIGPVPAIPSFRAFSSIQKRRPKPCRRVSTLWSMRPVACPRLTGSERQRTGDATRARFTPSFVEISWGEEKYTTQVIENSLSPKWSGETWSLDIQDESRLQDDPLIFKVCGSANSVTNR